MCKVSTHEFKYFPCKSWHLFLSRIWRMWTILLLSLVWLLSPGGWLTPLPLKRTMTEKWSSATPASQPALTSRAPAANCPKTEAFPFWSRPRATASLWHIGARTRITSSRRSLPWEVAKTGRQQQLHSCCACVFSIRPHVFMPQTCAGCCCLLQVESRVLCGWVLGRNMIYDLLIF